jgi:type I restriction enzyme M protein
VLTPGRYVGAEQIEEDDEAFEEKMKRLTATLKQQCEESKKLIRRYGKTWRNWGMKYKGMFYSGF